MRLKHSSGGATAHAGIGYQDRVAAWFAVHILAEKSVSIPWDLPSDIFLEFILCETEQPVDDLLVGTSAKGHIYIQVKHSLKCETSERSDLGSVIDQFVRQFIKNSKGKKNCGRIWEGSLNAESDRLVIVTSSRSSNPIQIVLPKILSRFPLVAGQSIVDAAKTLEENKILKVITDHIKRSWDDTLGMKPDNKNIEAILGLMRIHILDVDENGRDECDVKNILRNYLLKKPPQADSAWNSLINACSQYAILRSGADRNKLQQILLQKNIELKAPTSFHNDIELLKSISKSTLEYLADSSKIQIGSQELRINRKSLDKIKNTITEGSLVVTGEPGSGKSGLLNDLVKDLLNEGRDVIFIAANQFEAKSAGNLRNEIGLEHNFDEIIENWPGIKNGFLVIDAMDAARSPESSQTYLDLIGKVMRSGGRWRVITSIRKFDLRYNSRLKTLFRGRPQGESLEEELRNVSHLNIKELDDYETTQLFNQSKKLADFAKRASPELQELLKNLFNLRLIADLIGEGTSIQSLIPIQNSVELLNRYWEERVIKSDNNGYEREAILGEIVKKMVNKREIRVNLNEVPPGRFLHDLLSSNILKEWQPSPDSKPERRILTFPHHILFDFAVESLLLRGDAAYTKNFLEHDPELFLVIRPSIVTHFQYRWSLDQARTRFWDLVFNIINSSNIPVIGKIIGPSVAADIILTTTDCYPLLSELKGYGSSYRSAAELTFRYLTQAVLAKIGPKSRPLVGEDSPSWCELLEKVSESMNLSIAFSICPLLKEVCKAPEHLTPQQLKLAGTTARRLYEFAWSQEQRNSLLVIHALQTVCHTFKSNREKSAVLVRKCLEHNRSKKHLIEEAFWLSAEINYLIPEDPLLVEEIYKTSFILEITRNEETSIGNRILPLSSNLKQDLDGVRYELSRSYLDFLKSTPEQAVRTLIHVMEAYVKKERSTYYSEVKEEKFNINGIEGAIKTDYSAIWDVCDTHRNEPQLKMLDEFDKYIHKLCQNKNEEENLKKIVTLITKENRLAVIWRHLIICGKDNPDTLGLEIRDLTWTMPVLTNFDTSNVIGDFINTIYDRLNKNERTLVERAILSIPDAFPKEKKEQSKNVRNRLLGCLLPELILTDEAKKILQELQTKGGPPLNEPPVRFRGVSWNPDPEEDFLSSEGVPIDEEPNKNIRIIEKPVKDFSKKFDNASPDVDSIKEIFPSLRSMYEALLKADEEGVHPKQRDHAWGILADASEIICKSGLITSEDDVIFFREVLLKATQNLIPVYDPKEDEHFNEFLSWGMPATRISSAKGLFYIARVPDGLNNEVINAIEVLSKDKHPAVRYQVAAHLIAISKVAPDLMWRILERMCQEESNRGVLQGLLGYTLGSLALRYTDRIVEFVKCIYSRITEGKGAEKVRNLCVSILRDLYLQLDNQTAREIVFAITEKPETLYNEGHQLIVALNEKIAYGAIKPPEHVQKRAFTILEKITRSTRIALKDLENKNRDIPFNAWKQDSQEKTKQLISIADSLSREVYFASGAFDRKRNKEKILKSELGQKDIKYFLKQIMPTFEDLAEIGHPVIVHKLLEILEFIVDLDPEKIFLLVGQVLRSGKVYAYQYEPLAVDLIVRLLDRFLSSEFKYILHGNDECRKTLVEILDTFVEAGWPNALRLTYQLEEIYR